LYNAISQILPLIDENDIAFINAHGTATPYNDDMESVAIGRANLQDIPVNSLKSCFGHTLGAAGLLETVISMYAINDNLVLKSIGFEEFGVTNQINVSKNNSKTHKNSFLKLVSGFGGVNAAIVLQKK